MSKASFSPSDVIYRDRQGQPLKAKNRSQERIVASVHSNTVTFALGPAGSGKTFLAVLLGIKAIKNRSAKKLIITRPILEAGENLGYLPGDMMEKVDPYLRPLYDAIDKIVGIDTRQAYIDKGIIEIVPLAYMRGRTLEKAFIILDEAQNCEYKQLQMFLTRLGPNVKCVVTGDPSQCDLDYRDESALKHAYDILGGIRNIGFAFTTTEDVVRHKIVGDVINAYKDWKKTKHISGEDNESASVGVSINTNINIEQ